MRKYKVLFLDLDGTFTKLLGKKKYPSNICDFHINMDVANAVKAMAPEKVLICTNAGYIEYGVINGDHYEAMMNYFAAWLSEWAGTDCSVDFCSTYTNPDQDEYRKPNTGMYTKYQKEQELYNDYVFEKEDVLAVGDASFDDKALSWSNEDRISAEIFGCDYMDVKDFINEFSN